MTTKTRKAKSTKTNPEPHTPDAATPAETPQDTGTHGDTKSAKLAKADQRRVLSVNFPARTVRQLKLLASVQGVSLASIVIASVAKTVAKNLPAALEAISKADAESE